MAEYLRPTQIGDALEAMNARPLTVVAGGTDFYPARVGQPLDDDVLDISALGNLREIEARADHWRIPALATWTNVIEAELPPMLDGLKAAAREVGGVQIQNAGTVCGNLCNASPAADGVPPLLSLNATVELASVRGTRELPLDQFILGNRKTALGKDELMTALRVPRAPSSDARGAFVKLGARRYLVISIVMTAGVVESDAAGRITAARIAVGSCGPVAARLPELEQALLGASLTAKLADIARPEHVASLAPIDDIRGSADYRMHAALECTRRLLSALGGGS